MRASRTVTAAGLTSVLLAGTPARPQAPPAVNAPVLKWQRGGCSPSACQVGWYASPAVADLDRDGRPEVVWGAADLVVLDGATGSERARDASINRVWPGIVVADLSRDGTLEIVVARGNDRLTVYRPATTNGVMTLGVLWQRNPFGGVPSCARWPWTTSMRTARSRSWWDAPS
jgi:hypothetical protein